jgi:hypothetical protein
MAMTVRVVAIFWSVANEKQFARGFRSQPSPGRMMVLLRRQQATPTPNNVTARAEHGPDDAAIALALLCRDETSGFDPALIPARAPRNHCGASGSVTR